MAAPPKKCKKCECPAGEKWAVPFADFLSLQLALFIALYAIAVVNTDKRKSLAEAMNQIFDFSQSTPSVMPNSGMQSTAGQIKSPKKMASQQQQPSNSSTDQEQVEQAMKQLQAIKDAIPEVGNGSDSDIVMTDEGIRVRIFGPILFDAGSASLSQGSKRVIDMLANVVRQTPNQIKVEGFASEGAPARGGIYPSNWELSTARSCSVIRQFIANGIAPKRFMAVGFGDTKPLGPEQTLDQHYMNQRVEIVIMNYSGKADTPSESVLDEASNKKQ